MFVSSTELTFAQESVGSPTGPLSHVSNRQPYPRAWFAQASNSQTMFIRRYERPDREPTFELYGYAGNLAEDPVVLDLPEVPDELPSLDAAHAVAERIFHLKREDFRDVRLGRSLEEDVLDLLRTGSLRPLSPGVPAMQCVAVLGMPESVTRMAPGKTCWFYGSVQAHLNSGKLAFLEIDRGADDFTSLVLNGWFLTAASTIADVVERLAAERIQHSVHQICDLPAILVQSAPDGPPVMMDFDSDGRLHAFYWNLDPASVG